MALTFVLWKFSFTAKVMGFFSFRDIMIRIPLHLNFSLLIRIERLSFTFTFSSKILKLSTYGFQLNILLRNDFNLWQTKKIEILQMIEDLRTSLRRKGELKKLVQKANGIVSNLVNDENEQLQNQDQRANNDQQQKQGLLGQNMQNQVQNAKKTFMERMLDKLLSSFEVELNESMINFYTYLDEEKKIEETNLKRFYLFHLMDKEFRDRYLCFRVFIPHGDVSVKSLSEEEVDLQIYSERILIQNPVLANKQGVFKEVKVLIKIPLDKKLAKDFCNFDVRVNILRGTMNMNKKFIKAITLFLVNMDTLKDIIKRVKRVITKLHYQEELLAEKELNDQYPNFENFMDIDIPKRLKVVIEEGLSVILIDPSRKLKPFLSAGDNHNRMQEFVMLNTNQITFELLRTLKNSYYITCQSSKLSVDCNMKETIVVKNFVQEMDFCFKKQVKDSPLRFTKMEINNVIKMDNLIVDLTMSEVKLIYDIVDIYVQMVSFASVKNKIMRQVLDRDFMKNNLLYLSSSQIDQAKEQQILSLFEEAKFKDSLINDIIINKIERKFSTYDPSNSIKLDGTNFKFRLKDVNGIEELITTLDFLNIQPMKPRSISMLKVQNFKNNVTATKASQHLIKNIDFKFDRCHFNLNMDQILSITREILDYTFIAKTYTRKWDSKYAVKEKIKQSIIESLCIHFQESQFIWNMSSSRYLAFRLIDFKTKPIMCPFKNEDKIGVCYTTKELTVYHSKTFKQDTVQGHFYCIPHNEKSIESIIDIMNFEYKMIANAKETKLKLQATSLEFNLPQDLHFGAITHEIVKQINVSSSWFSSEYMKIKQKYGIQFYKPQNNQRQNYSHQNSFVPAVKGRKKTLYLQIDVKEATLKADESDFRLLFVNKNEVVDTLAEREIFKCKGPVIFKMLKKLKQSKLNEKAMTYYLQNFRMVYEVPQQFLDFNQVYQVIQKLDEARDCMTQQLFKELDGAFHTYTCDYIAWHVRNLMRPMVEIWGVDVRFMFINAALNPDINPNLFKSKVWNRIFKKYEIISNFNKLMTKQYYDAEIKLDKIKANVQGQQTLLFLNDYGDILKRFGFDDLSKDKDPKAVKLNYYSGIDLIRNRMHGKSKIIFNDLECLVYPKRKLNRFESYMKLKLQDMIYSQIHNYQELCFRNLSLSKCPLRSWESGFLKIPLFELQINMIYNQGKTTNHFTHNGAVNIGQYLDQLKAFSSHELEIDCKLNIPSLGHRNDVEKQTNQITSVFPSYFDQSPIPILHYQRSHMKFFDSMIKEYCQKSDYSGAVLKRREGGGKQKIQARRSHLFKIKIKAFINDMMAMFSDFREDKDPGNFAEMILNQHNLKIERDRFLQIYQGIIFNYENLCFKSQILVKKLKDGNHIELRNSAIQCNFMRLSYMNNNNLFSIRHKCFNELRQKQYGHSMDSFKYFCQFFEINPMSSSASLELHQNSVLVSFKTLFPAYILKNIPLQQDIMIATLNPDSFNPFLDDVNAIVEDFVFSNTDTIGTLLLLSYQQDKEISFYHNSSQKMEERKHQQRVLNPLILDLPTNQLEEERLTVKHMIDVKGVKFLYTQNTTELIIHHMVHSFNYAKLRKTDFVDVEAQREGNFNDYEANRGHSKQKPSCDHSANKSDERTSQISFKQLKRTALIGLRLEDPQFNFQNEFTKSQMLLTTSRPTTAVIFGYSKNQSQSPHGSSNMYSHPSDDIMRTTSGYQIKFHEQIIRYDLQIQVVEMDIFVAPTVINLENPTFWISEHGQIHITPSDQRDSKTSDKATGPDRDNYKNENLLRKIITVHNISFTFDFLKEEFVDNVNPKMSIDILVEKLESEMNGPNMWHFVYVLKCILFERGFKTDEILINERLRHMELQEMKVDIIRSIIDQKLKRGFSHMGSESKSNIGKKIQYTILNGEFKLYNFEQLFSTVVVSKVSGTHFIYENRESKVGIDIDKIVIENWADQEAYRMVLFPGYSLHTLDTPQHSQMYQETMIKIRARDKCVVVKEAPWQVYDQFEVFIFPTSLQFTKNFYKQIKNFFFADMPNTDDSDKAQLEAKKYELLVPTKALKKAQEQFREQNRKDDEYPKAMIVVDQQKRTLHFRTDSKGSGLLNQDDDDSPKDRKIATKDKKSQSNNQFPIFFRYMRMNEIGVSITYYHNKNSFFNSKDLKIKINPFIRHGKFVTFKKIFEKYEHHCKKNFISQIPSLLKQKFLKTKENLMGSSKDLEDMEDDDDEQLEIKKELKLQNARKLLFGEFYQQ